MLNERIVRILVAIVASSMATSGTGTIGFRKGSKFFLRMNFKDNILSATTIFAHAAGFKVIWDLPELPDVQRRRSIRDIHEDVQYIYESHGLDGKSCLLKNICDAALYVDGRSGVVAKLLRLFMGDYLDENGTLAEGMSCSDYRDACPMELTGISPVASF